MGFISTIICVHDSAWKLFFVCLIGSAVFSCFALLHLFLFRPIHKNAELCFPWPHMNAARIQWQSCICLKVSLVSHVFVVSIMTCDIAVKTWPNLTLGRPNRRSEEWQPTQPLGRGSRENGRYDWFRILPQVWNSSELESHRSLAIASGNRKAAAVETKPEADGIERVSGKRFCEDWQPLCAQQTHRHKHAWTHVHKPVTTHIGVCVCESVFHSKTLWCATLVTSYYNSITILHCIILYCVSLHWLSRRGHHTMVSHHGISTCSDIQLP